jgi:hypothetical protein
MFLKKKGFYISTFSGYVTTKDLKEIFIVSAGIVNPSNFKEIDPDYSFVNATCGRFFNPKQCYEVRYNYIDLVDTLLNRHRKDYFPLPFVIAIADVSIFKVKTTDDKNVTLIKDFINNEDYLNRIHEPIVNTALPNKNFEKNCLGIVDFEIFNKKLNTIKKGQLNVIGYGHRQYTMERRNCFEILYLAVPAIGSVELVRGDSGAPLYINNKFHSFVNGSYFKDDKLMFYILAPANLVLKQIENFIGKKCFFCDISINLNNDNNNENVLNNKASVYIDGDNFVFHI